MPGLMSLLLLYHTSSGDWLILFLIPQIIGHLTFCILLYNSLCAVTAISETLSYALFYL